MEERTAELVDARDQAKSLARDQERFLVSVCRKPRTPLHGVMGLVDLALQEAVSVPKLRELLAEQRAYGDHLLGIINERVLQKPSRAEELLRVLGATAVRAGAAARE